MSELRSPVTGETEIDKLKQAIASLEAQRQALGDEVVELALAPLREKLASLQSAAQGEQRRVVTVLFADLADHTTLFAHLDPEDVRELLNAYFSAWKTVIAGQGGVVEKFIGDAVMAVFGLNVAQENDPERAIHAALEMRREMDALNEAIRSRHGTQLAMRVGITTGEVVVSTLGERMGEEFVVVGETVNLASRLQGLAPSGGILIAHETYTLVRGVFNVQPVAPMRVKGMEEPVQAYLVNSAKPRAFRLVTRGVEGVETRMVGRADELRALQAAFRQAVEGRQCRVVTITGEAGIGKSRLIYEFDNWLELLPETIFYFKGRAYPSTRNFPYSLIRSLFAFRFQIHDSDTPAEVWRKLLQGIGAVLGDDDGGRKKAFLIGRLLGFETGPQPAWPDPADPRQAHELALTYLAEYFRALAERNPVVVLLEDLHAADNSSLDLAQRLDQAMHDQRLLVVCTTRPELLERRPAWGTEFGYHTRLDLAPLSRGESQGLVDEILRRMQMVPEELRALVVERAEGNPFFIEEGIKMLIEEGVIEKAGGEWRVAQRQLTQVKIPYTLTGLLQARLDSLQPAQRALLQRAAVIGRVFWDQAVEYLAEPQAVQAETDPTGPLLGALREREIVFRREQSNFANTREYLFKHALFRDVTYESLLKRQRRAYHARAARWLEQVTGQNQRADEYAALIALHYDQAGEPAPAAAWHLRAAEQAAAHYANAEAVHAYTQALERTPTDDLQARYDILMSREKILDRQGSREQQAADLHTLAGLAEQLGSPTAACRVALRQANLNFTTSEYDRSTQAAHRAVELARQAGDVEKEAEGYYLWGRSLDFQAASPEAMEKFEQALALARSAGMRRLEADIHMSMGPHFSDIGEFAEARKHLTLALEAYRQVGDRFGEGKALGNLGVSYWGQADHEQAQRYFEAALQVVREIGDRRVEGILVGNLGVVARETLNYSASQVYNLQALQINREIRSKHSECINLGNYAEVLMDLGDFAEARRCYEQALATARELGILPVQSGVRMGMSQLMDYLDDQPAALAYAEEALALAREAQNPVYETGCLMRLAQALLKAGQLEEAAANYQAALELQQKLDMHNRALESRAGLARVSLAAGDLPAALAQVELILQSLAPQALLGTDEPLRVYLTCAQVLQAAADPRASAVLEEGYHFAQKLAAQVENEAQRRSFLQSVPPNRQLIELWENRPNLI